MAIEGNHAAMYQGSFKLGGGRLQHLLFSKDGILFAAHTCGGNTKKDAPIVSSTDVNKEKPKPKPKQVVSMLDPRLVSDGSWIGTVNYLEQTDDGRLLMIYDQYLACVIDLATGELVKTETCSRFPSLAEAVSAIAACWGEYGAGFHSPDKRYLARGIRQPGTEHYNFLPKDHMGWLRITEVASGSVVFEEKVTADHNFSTIAFCEGDDSYIALASGRSSDVWIKQWK